MFKFAAFSASFVVVMLLLPKPTLAYTTNMNASIVIGQQDFISSGGNQNGPVDANTLQSDPRGLDSNGTNLIIADTDNNRVLIYKIPTQNNARADVVIGQTDFNSSGSGTAANTLSRPRDVRLAGNKLIIADEGNNRVLIYNSVPTQNNASANVVIGQTDFTSNSNGITATTFANNLRTVDYDSASGKLLVADRDNNRILIYNSLPTTNGTAANVVVGQSDFTSNSSGTTATQFSNPESARVLDGKLLVADRDNNRTLVWNSIPTTNGKAADVVIGQQNFTSGSQNQGGSTAANTLNNPRGTAWDGKRLFIADWSNHRVLIYNSIPASNNASAYQVIGQPDFNSNQRDQGGTVAANTLSNINIGILAVGNQLIVSDGNNARVLIYNNIIQKPNISINNFEDSAPAGKVRIKGRATVDSLYTTQKVEYSTNGGAFIGATAVDGTFDGNAENFYVDFDAGGNNNKLPGYTLRIRAQNTNLDDTDSLFFFTPFNAISPADDEATTSALPSFEFSVNKQRTWMRDYLKKYQVQIAKDGTEAWKVYIDNIPLDFQSNKNRNDNLQRSKYLLESSLNNGNFETKEFLATYADESSRVKVTSKDLVDFKFPSGRKLTPGTYEWKVVSIDKSGHEQSTGIRTLTITTKPKTATTIAAKTAVLAQKDYKPEIIHESQPSAQPTPTPSPQTQQSNNKHRFCIWFLCF